MPPLPTTATFNDEAQQLIDYLERSQNDIQTFQIPRLRQCSSSLAEQQKLAAELREDMQTFARRVEALELTVEDHKGQIKKQQIRARVDEFREAHVKMSKDSRAALLASKRSIDSQSLSQREELLRSSTIREKGPDANEKVTEDALMKATNDVTEALRRTLGMMQGELERSVLSSQMLESSTATMRSTSSAHDTLLNVMDTSKQLVTALEKSDWLDRMLIIAGLIFFFLVVGFIVKQRIIDRSLRIALWWTRFVPNFSGDAALLHAEAGLAKTIATASSIVASLSTTAVVATTSLPLPSSSVEISSAPQVTGVAETTTEITLESLLETSELDTAVTSIFLMPAEIPDHDALHDEL